MRFVLESPDADPTTTARPPFCATSLYRLNTFLEKEVPDASKRDLLCVEHSKHGRRIFQERDPGSPSARLEIIEFAESKRVRLKAVLANYLLPQGYPDSVGPQYANYMYWRAVQYFFGGAMSVFTTRCLLRSLNIANRSSGEAAAAINWVVKDGAGRFGRFLFARWGRSLDGELKQFRLMGDVLMEGGAALELATALLPNAFLPLACTANLAKNLAAVTASATRAPIYRTFARRNNLADVTAKGESVANLADVVGTVAGIALARAGAPALPAFALLSVGYLYASRREVDAVVLPFFNRARLTLAVRGFADSGGRHCPTPAEAAAAEPMLPRPGSRQARVVLGAPAAAAAGPGPEGEARLRAALAALRAHPFAIAYRPDRHEAHVLLRRDAGAEDALRGALCAHFLLDAIEGKGAGGAGLDGGAAPRRRWLPALRRPHSLLQDPRRAMARLRARVAAEAGASADEAARVRAAQRIVDEESPTLCASFFAAARAQGWDLAHTRLNPQDSRVELLHHAKPLG